MVNSMISLMVGLMVYGHFKGQFDVCLMDYGSFNVYYNGLWLIQ